jgi:UMF1 family MFS transporter
MDTRKAAPAVEVSGAGVESASSSSSPLYASPVQRNLAIASWGFFDLGVTIFSLNILSRYFALWVSQDNAQPDIVYSAAFSISLAFVAISSPVLGTVSDRAGQRLPYLLVMTVSSTVATALIGLANNLWAGLLLFMIANYGYQSTQVFYNALLSTISTRESRGRISGIGQGIGYLGSLVAIFATAPFLTKLTDSSGKVLTDSDGNPLLAHVSAFVPTAVLMAIFCTPIFFFMHEQKRSSSAPKVTLTTLVRQSFGEVVRSIKNARQYPNLFRFLVARLFYADAANTAVAFMAIYANKAVHMSDSEVNIVLAFGVIFAIVGAFGAGFIADTFGPKRALYVVLGTWAVAIISAALTQEKVLFYGIAALIGLGLGALRTSDRTFLITVAPPEMLGEAFGLYGVVGEFSSIIGPLLWGFITLALDSAGDVKYRVAVASLLIPLIFGWFILRKAQDKLAARTLAD